MGNVCQCCGARDKDPSLLPDYASGGNSQHGFALAKNDRGRMEDAVAISDNVAGHACFAVFDGHGGDKATVLAKQFLPLQLEKHLEQESNKEKAAHQAFAAMDELMQKQLAEEAKVLTAGTSSGTVACIALLEEGELVLLNLGDCRAVVCENGKVGTSTRDHHPEKNDQEKQRLEKLGVCIEGGYVDGKVQVSRALGDIVDKTGQKILGLSNTPEVTRIEVKKTTEFVILATDGVWDGLREQLAITTARKILRETKSAEGAAKAVLEAAGKVTKADNAAVIVVSLNIPEPLPKRDAPPSLFLLFHEASPQNHVKEPAAYNTLMPPNTVSIGCPTQNQRAGFQHLTVKVQIAQAPAFQIQDMAIRVFSAKSRALLSTLPPPPNAKEWQLLILWLSSEEVAIFYVPSAPLEKSKAEEQPIPRTQAATPLLLRRFSIVEVRTQMMDKDLSKESFRCVSLYHGPLPKGDTLLHTVKVAQQVLEEDSSPASPRRPGSLCLRLHLRVALKHQWLKMALACPGFSVQHLGAQAPPVLPAQRQRWQGTDAHGRRQASAAAALCGGAAASVAARCRRRAEGSDSEASSSTSEEDKSLGARFKRWWQKNAKMDSKSLRKMGLMCLLSYGFVSNVNALLLILLATYRSIVATGASPLASPVALKQFGITWAGLYVISNIVRPVRISIALAISQPFDNMVNWLQEKLSCKRWMAVGLVVLLLNVVLTIAFLWGGMLFVSSITGVKVDPSQFGTLVKAGRDWYLLVGTQMGTLQAFKIADLLMQLPVWGRLRMWLVGPGRAKTMRASVLKGAIKEADGRLAEIEKEHEAAMETPGQRPFPPSGPQLKLYSRWRRHDYSIDFVKSMADLILTIDAKNGLKVCQAEDSRILFRLRRAPVSTLVEVSEPPRVKELWTWVSSELGTREDQRSTEGHAQGQVESAAEVPPPSSPQLLGVTLGNSRGSLEMVELPWTSPDVEVFSSQASHGGPVLQVDYLLPIEIFVSVGEDDTVRFWSSALQLLREVFFPQPCSTVAFLRLPDMDTSAGHGDVLVGFAAHVERVPMDVWARGVKHEKLGGTLPLDSTMRSSQGSKATGSSAFTKSSTQEMDELLLQELNRFSPEDEDVLGERPPSSEVVKLVDEELPKRRRSRTVMDFRGFLAEVNFNHVFPASYNLLPDRAPVVPLGVLGGLAADMVGVEERLSHRPEALEHVPHEHSQVLDQGDLRAITRYHAGYYDWTVNPSAMVDAPRGCAIRGAGPGSRTAFCFDTGKCGVVAKGTPPKPQVGKKTIGDASRSGPSTAARTKAMADQVAKPRPPLTSSTETMEQPVAKIQVPLMATPKQMQAMFDGELVPMAGEDAIGMLRAVHAAFNLCSSLSGGERCGGRMQSTLPQTMLANGHRCWQGKFEFAGDDSTGLEMLVAELHEDQQEVSAAAARVAVTIVPVSRLLGPVTPGLSQPSASGEHTAIMVGVAQIFNEKVTGDGNVAIVTSVGIGHLRGEGHAFQPAPQEAPSEELFAHTSLEEELEAGELPDEAPLALPGALEECVEETDDEGMVNDEDTIVWSQSFLHCTTALLGRRAYSYEHQAYGVLLAANETACCLQDLALVVCVAQQEEEEDTW
ncbi:unnamed protein product, partial [Symbiodinium microadriaticum]